MWNRNHLRQKRHKEDGKATDAFSERQSFRKTVFLAHFAQLFSHRGRPEVCREQERMSRLKKRVKNNVSIFSGGDE